MVRPEKGNILLVFKYVYLKITRIVTIFSGLWLATR